MNLASLEVCYLLARSVRWSSFGQLESIDFHVQSPTFKHHHHPSCLHLPVLLPCPTFRDLPYSWPVSHCPASPCNDSLCTSSHFPTSLCSRGPEACRQEPSVRSFCHCSRYHCFLEAAPCWWSEREIKIWNAGCLVWLPRQLRIANTVICTCLNIQ